MKRLFIILMLFSIIVCKTPEEWKSRTIYQLLTDRFASSHTQECQDLSNYCGGGYSALTDKLDYIQGMGFDAIWISPIVSNTEGGYHGYWQKNLYELNTNFGSSDDLKKLVSECHSRGIYVMLDIVGNHVGPCPNDDFSIITPFNTSKSYHPKCEITDWNNQTQVEICRLADLPDLKQEDDFVKNALLQWIKNTVDEYSFDGLRVDTAREVPKWFWSEYTESAGVYTVGEIEDGRVWLVAEYQGPLSSALSYPLFFTLRNVFHDRQSMYQIESTWKDYVSKFTDLDLLGTFIDNHDQERFLHSGSLPQYMNAIVFVFTAQGIPIIYYGTEQEFSGGNDPQNRESLWPHYSTESDMYVFIKQMISLKKSIKWYKETQVQRYADDTFYAFTRGSTFISLTNSDDEQTRTITYHPYSEGETLCNVFDASQKDCVTVSNSEFNVSLSGGSPKIFVPKQSFYDDDTG